MTLCTVRFPSLTLLNKEVGGGIYLKGQCEDPLPFITLIDFF